jgi:hypothetical protein
MVSRWLRRSGLVATAVGSIASCGAQTLPVGSNHTGPAPGAGDDASMTGASADAGIGPCTSPPCACPPPPSSCTDPATSAGACGSIEQQSLAIRQRSCAACHGPPPAPGPGAFNFVLDDARLVASHSNNYTNDAGMLRRLVIPGDPEDSWLYQRITAPIGSVERMPPLNAAQFIGPAAAASLVVPTASDISVLYEWILSCLGVDGRAVRMDASTAVYGAVDGGNDGASVDDGAVRGAADVASEAAVDAPADIGVDSTAPSGLATFAFIVNGVVQTSLTCPSDNWEFAAVDANGNYLCVPLGNPCPGVTSAVVKNTGQVPIAYIALPRWSGGAHYVPGVLTGDPNELTGVLDPDEQIDITASFAGGSTALLGSAASFSNPDAGKYLSDEGTIPWPAGVRGSGGATQMSLAEIEVRGACMIANQVW